MIIFVLFLILFLAAAENAYYSKSAVKSRNKDIIEQNNQYFLKRYEMRKETIAKYAANGIIIDLETGLDQNGIRRLPMWTESEVRRAIELCEAKK